MVGTVCKGRLGLGNYGPQQLKTTDPRKRRALLVEEMIQKKKAEE